MNMKDVALKIQETLTADQIIDLVWEREAGSGYKSVAFYLGAIGLPDYVLIASIDQLKYSYSCENWESNPYLPNIKEVSLNSTHEKLFCQLMVANGTITSDNYDLYSMISDFDICELEANIRFFVTDRLEQSEEKFYTCEMAKMFDELSDNGIGSIRDFLFYGDDDTLESAFEKAIQDGEIWEGANREYVKAIEIMFHDADSYIDSSCCYFDAHCGNILYRPDGTPVLYDVINCNC